MLSEAILARIAEEPDVGKLQVRFCEGHSKSLTAIGKKLISYKE